MLDVVPADVPHAAAEAARDSLGGALAVAERLPGDSGRALIDAAREAFTQGLHLTAVIGAILAVGVAVMVAVKLRDVRGGATSEEGASEVSPVHIETALAEC